MRTKKFRSIEELTEFVSMLKKEQVITIVERVVPGYEGFFNYVLFYWE